MTKLSHAEQCRLWQMRNKGLITQISREEGVSQPFVSDVLYLRRKSLSGRIEKRLAQAGAPGFERYLEAELQNQQ